jgi:hypothetical protein
LDNCDAKVTAVRHIRFHSQNPVVRQFELFPESSTGPTISSTDQMWSATPDFIDGVTTTRRERYDWGMSDRPTKPFGPIGWIANRSRQFWGWIASRSRRFWIVVIILMPVVYVASFGPACWLTATPPETAHIKFWLCPHLPLVKYAHKGGYPGSGLLEWWMSVGVPQGYSLAMPHDWIDAVPRSIRIKYIYPPNGQPPANSN